MHKSIYHAKISCTVNTQDENLKKKITTKNEKRKERQGFLQELTKVNMFSRSKEKAQTQKRNNDRRSKENISIDEETNRESPKYNG